MTKNKEKKMNSKQLERILKDALEEQTFEEFLEQFDLTAFELFELAYASGLIDDVILESIIASDE